MKNSSLLSSQQRLLNFIDREFGESDKEYQLIQLSGDASTREYFRYISRTDESFIFTLYPESFDPLHFNYKEIHELLQGIGLPVPETINMDGNLGIVLQQDLGDKSLQKHLKKIPLNTRKSMLFNSIDYIIVIQKEGTSFLKPEYQAYSLFFDEKKLNWELDFFHNQYLDNHRKLKINQKEFLQQEFKRLSSELASSAQLLCHRDYQTRNLMLKQDQIFIIDFQDARHGPLSYDLVSLLKDSILLEPDEIAEYYDYYLDQASKQFGEIIPKDFNRQFHLMSIQRLLKALGTYGYQISIRGKSVYRQYIRGSLQRMLLSLQALPEFPYIQSIVAKELDS